MESTIATTTYWCHACSQAVNPVMEVEIKCPFCQSGFLEEMENNHDDVSVHRPNHSLWFPPILMETMNDTLRRRATNQNQNVEVDQQNADGGRESDSDEMLRRRRRHSAAVLQLLHGIRAGLLLESAARSGESDDNNNPNRDRERTMIVINPFNQTMTVQTSVGLDGSLGDYFIGPGFETLLQRLAENDPNRYGTPPARKEAIEALETVKIEETLQCSVCLDDFEIGTEAKEMPCKHRFHSDCLLPWLELHSSCPVCRYQLPADETKTDSARNDGVNNASGTTTSSYGTARSDREGGNRTGFSIPWPFSSLFSSSQDNNASTDSG